MRAILILLVLFLVFAGCPSNGPGGSSPLIIPYFEIEEFSEVTGEMERYVPPQPDEYGYASQQYTAMGISCSNGNDPEIVSFSWENPSNADVYIAGSPNEPKAHYRAKADAVFSISLRVDYLCDGRPEIIDLESQRKSIPVYFAEDGFLYEQDSRATCPGNYMPYLLPETHSIGKGITPGSDSGDGWVVLSHTIVVAEPYDYPAEGCGKYDEHWLHTYMRESVNGTGCEVGECRGFWHTFECPGNNEQGVRREVYAGKNCVSVSQQKDFRNPSEWFVLLDGPEFQAPTTKGLR
jgi:hypothetical protein